VWEGVEGFGFLQNPIQHRSRAVRVGRRAPLREPAPTNRIQQLGDRIPPWLLCRVAKQGRMGRDWAICPIESQHRSQLSNSIRGVRLYVTAESLRALGFSWGMCRFPLGTLRAPPSGVASGELNTLGGPLRHRPGMGFLISREGPSRVRGIRFWHNRRQKGGTSLVADLSATDLVPSDRAPATQIPAI